MNGLISAGVEHAFGVLYYEDVAAGIGDVAVVHGDSLIAFRPVTYNLAKAMALMEADLEADLWGEVISEALEVVLVWCGFKEPEVSDGGEA